MANCIANGNLYENGKANEIKVAIGSDIRVQAKGNGSFQLVGKLIQSGAEKVLELVDLSDFSTVTTVKTEDIYAGDVTGFYSVIVQNVSGFEKIWCTITY